MRWEESAGGVLTNETPGPSEGQKSLRFLLLTYIVRSASPRDAPRRARTWRRAHGRRPPSPHGPTANGQTAERTRRRLNARLAARRTTSDAGRDLRSLRLGVGRLAQLQAGLFELSGDRSELCRFVSRAQSARLTLSAIRYQLSGTWKPGPRCARGAGRFNASDVKLPPQLSTPNHRISGPQGCRPNS